MRGVLFVAGDVKNYVNNVKADRKHGYYKHHQILRSTFKKSNLI